MATFTQTIKIILLSLFIMEASIVGASEKSITVGAQAPDFSLSDQHNKTQTLSQMKGKWVVLYFYPKNETPGCVAEACSFRDNIVAIKAKNTIVVGVSVDNKESHAEFSKNHQLPFILLADPEGKVAKEYGSLLNLLLFKVAKRHSFIIDPQGNIAKIYRNVNPKSHVAEILKDLQTLQSN